MIRRAPRPSLVIDVDTILGPNVSDDVGRSPSTPKESVQSSPTPPAAKKRKLEEPSLKTAVDKANNILNTNAETSHQYWAQYVASVMNNHPKKDGVRSFKFRVTRLLEQLEEGEMDPTLTPYTMPIPISMCLQSANTTEKDNDKSHDIEFYNM